MEQARELSKKKPKRTHGNSKSEREIRAVASKRCAPLIKKIGKQSAQVRLVDNVSFTRSFGTYIDIIYVTYITIVILQVAMLRKKHKELDKSTEQKVTKLESTNLALGQRVTALSREVRSSVKKMDQYEQQSHEFRRHNKELATAVTKLTKKVNADSSSYKRSVKYRKNKINQLDDEIYDKQCDVKKIR